MHDQLIDLLLTGTLDTLIMVGVSALLAFLIGLPLAVILVSTSENGIYPSQTINQPIGWLINVTRSIPFLILMVALMPFTAWLVGTKIGPVAASLSLAIAAIPFFARLVETALREVHSGKLDAAQAMGSTKWQSITKVLLPEAMPSLVASFTTTVVTIVGYSAMAGLVGGGGLGRLAYNYGFQRYQVDVMIMKVVLLIVLVQIIQWTGDAISKAIDHR